MIVKSIPNAPKRFENSEEFINSYRLRGAKLKALDFSLGVGHGYHRIRLAPHVKPDPKATMAIRSPFFSIPAALAS